MIDIKILSEPLDITACLAAVTTDECGGEVLFTGTVRNKTQGKPVVRLEYECYNSMARKELKKIADYATEKWEVSHVVIHHRMGTLSIGDIAVIIAVGSAHRQAAFTACKYIIDTLKQTVPIWKKEVFEDGEEWVSAHA